MYSYYVPRIPAALQKLDSLHADNQRYRDCIPTSSDPLRIRLEQDQKVHQESLTLASYPSVRRSLRRL